MYGLVFNWERPGDYDAVVCASEDESGDEAVASVRVHGGVPELVETGRRQRGEGRPAQEITIKQVTDGASTTPAASGAASRPACA